MSGATMIKQSLTAAIYRFRAEWASYLANSLEAEEKGEPDVAYTVEPHARVLGAWDQPATHEQEAILALELALEDYEMGDTPRIPAMIKAALGYLKANASGVKAPTLRDASGSSTKDLCNLYRAIDTIEETANMAASHIESISRDTPAYSYLVDLQEYLGAERVAVVSALRERPDTSDASGQFRLAILVQFEAWCQEFHKETLDQLSASPLSKDAIRKGRA